MPCRDAFDLVRDLDFHRPQPRDEGIHQVWRDEARGQGLIDVVPGQVILLACGANQIAQPCLDIGRVDVVVRGVGKFSDAASVAVFWRTPPAALEQLAIWPHWRWGRLFLGRMNARPAATPLGRGVCAFHSNRFTCLAGGVARMGSVGLFFGDGHTNSGWGPRPASIRGRNYSGVVSYGQGILCASQ